MFRSIVSLREKELDLHYHTWKEYIDEHKRIMWREWFNAINKVLDDMHRIMKMNPIFLNNWIHVLSSMQPQIYFSEDESDDHICTENLILLQSQWDTAFKELYSSVEYFLKSYELMTNTQDVESAIETAYVICKICLSLQGILCFVNTYMIYILKQNKICCRCKSCIYQILLYHTD